MRAMGIFSMMVVAGLGVSLIVGCEDSSSTGSPDYPAVTITPVTSTLTVSGAATNRITYTASGGDGVFAWSVNVDRLGSLDDDSGRRVIYTPTRATGVNIITVRSRGEAAEARVTQR